MADIQLRVTTDHTGAVTGLGLVSSKLDSVAGSADKSQAKVSGFSSVLQGIGQGAGQRIFDGLASAAAALPNFVLGATKAVMDYGGQLIDTAARTGISVEAQQQLAFAGAQVGVTMDQITGATAKMQQALVETPEKFDRIGLSADHLRTLAPEQQFVAIGEKLSGIKDPAERSAAAIEIFGKTGAALLPLLTSGMGDVMKRAQELGFVMSEDVAGAADDLGDSTAALGMVWDGLVRNFGAAIVTSEPLHVLIEGLTEIVGSFSSKVNEGQGTLRSFVDGGVMFVAEALVRMVEVVGFGVDAWSGFKIVAIGAGAEVEKLGLKLALLADVMTGEIGPIVALKAAKLGEIDIMARAGAAVSEEMAKNAERHGVLDKVGGAFRELADKVADSAGKTHAATGKTKEGTAAHLAAKKAAGEHEKAIKELSKAMGEYFDKLAGSRTSREAEAMHDFAGTADEVSLQMGILAGKITDTDGNLLDLTDKALVDAIDKLREMEAAGGDNTFALQALAAAIAEAGRRGVLADAELAAFTATMKASGAAADAAAEAQARLKAALAYASDIGNNLRDLPGIFQELGGAMGEFGDSLAGGMDSIDQLMSADTWAGVAAGVVGVGKSFLAVTDTGNDALRAIGGAAMGAQLGFQFAGPWGAAIGGVIGGLAGLLRGDPEWVESGKQAGEVFGHAISDELAQIIQEDMDDLGLTAPEAALLHISEAMDEGGAEARMYADDVQALMAGIADGSIPAVEGLDQVGEMFTRIQEEAEEAGRVGDRAMVAILESARATGTMTDEMQGFVDEKIEQSIAGMERFAEGLSHMDGEWGDQGANASTIFMATFDAAIKEKGLYGALEALGPSFELLRDKFEDEGDEASLAFLGPFARLHDLMSAEDGVFAGAVGQAEGLGDVLVGLADSGYLTEAALGAIGSQLEAVFTTLTEGGATSDEALQAILPTLGDAVSAAEQYGYSLDDATQSLVDQAEAAGYSFPKDPMLAMVDLLGQIVVLMGGELPAAGERAAAALTDSADQAEAGWENAGEAIEAAAYDVEAGWADAAEGISDALVDAMDTSEDAVDPLVSAVEGAVDRMNDLTITIPVHWDADAPPHMPGWGGGPGPGEFAHGGVIDAPLTGAPAILHGQEAITPLDMVYSRMADIVAGKLAAAGGGGMGGGMIQLNLYADQKAGTIEEITPAQAAQIRQLVASGLVPFPARAIGRN